MLPDGHILLNASLLKDLRRMHGLSQEALAQLCFERRLRVSIASIKRAEAGKALLYRTARHLAAIFEIPLHRLATASGCVAPTHSPQGFDVPAELKAMGTCEKSAS